MCAYSARPRNATKSLSGCHISAKRKQRCARALRLPCGLIRLSKPEPSVQTTKFAIRGRKTVLWRELDIGAAAQMRQLWANGCLPKLTFNRQLGAPFPSVKPVETAPFSEFSGCRRLAPRPDTQTEMLAQSRAGRQSPKTTFRSSHDSVLEGALRVRAYATRASSSRFQGGDIKLLHPDD
jgi:hypothetical protein